MIIKHAKQIQGNKILINIYYMNITTVILNMTKGNNICFKYIKGPADNISS
jgi:hypothetical protein